ncbi:HepT-like ribonuclease domain-containing protein [Ferrimicrobium sp.]
MRNILIHEYFGVDKDIVHDVITTKLWPLDEVPTRHAAQNVED